MTLMDDADAICCGKFNIAVFAIRDYVPTYANDSITWPSRIVRSPAIEVADIRNMLTRLAKRKASE